MCATLEIMSHLEVAQTAAPVKPERKLSAAELAVTSAREKLTRYLDRAVQILEELAETSENDRVRLAAVDSILDRAGLGKESKQQVTTGTSAEHDVANREAADILAAIQRNQQQVAQGTVGVSLDALIVHEGTDLIEVPGA